MVALTILIWMKTSYVECADHTIWYAINHNGSGNAEILNLCKIKERKSGTLPCLIGVHSEPIQFRV